MVLYDLFALLFFFPTNVGGSNSSHIIGAIVGSSVFLLMLMIAGIYALKQKRRAERANEQINPFGKNYKKAFYYHGRLTKC